MSVRLNLGYRAGCMPLMVAVLFAILFVRCLG